MRGRGWWLKRFITATTEEGTESTAGTEGGFGVVLLGSPTIKETLTTTAC